MHRIFQIAFAYVYGGWFKKLSRVETEIKYNLSFKMFSIEYQFRRYVTKICEINESIQAIIQEMQAF